MTYPHPILVTPQEIRYDIYCPLETIAGHLHDAGITTKCIGNMTVYFMNQRQKVKWPASKAASAPCCHLKKSAWTITDGQ